MTSTTRTAFLSELDQLNYAERCRRATVLGHGAAQATTPAADKAAVLSLIRELRAHAAPAAAAASADEASAITTSVPQQQRLVEQHYDEYHAALNIAAGLGPSAARFVVFSFLVFFCVCVCVDAGSPRRKRVC